MSGIKIPIIEKGADFNISFRLTKNGVAEPLGLGSSPPDEVTVLLPTQDPNTNSLAFLLSTGGVTVESDPRGEFNVIGSEAESVLLEQGQKLDIVVKIKRGTEDIIKNLKNAITVESQVLSDP